MVLTTLVAVSIALTAARACPIAAERVLPELSGTWQVLMVSGLDRVRPDSVSAQSVIAPDLQNCLLREQLKARSGTYEALILWGVNGGDSSIQRVFTHSNHGRFGMYQGRRSGNLIPLRQLSQSSPPTSEVVENRVFFADGNRFTITSQLSNDGGTTWTALSRLEYQRPSQNAAPDSFTVLPLKDAPRVDGRIDDREYGGPLLIATAGGPARVWIGRHDDFIYIAADLPDSTFYWGDDFVVSFNPAGNGGTTLNAGDRQWYLRRTLDSSVVTVAVPGRCYAPGHEPSALGSTRHHSDWDVASTSSSTRWVVELRVRASAVRTGAAAPRIAFRTYNDKPAGWWSWPAPTSGLPAQRVERNPDLWIPLRLQ